jgi:glycogen debranching enzyme
MHPASRRDARLPAGRETRDARKQRVLTHGTPSLTRAIADAIVLKDSDLFLITERDGSVPGAGDHGLGLYYHDIRFLRTYEFQINGQSPVALGSVSGGGYRSSLQLTNPELGAAPGAVIPRETLGIEWARALDGRALALSDTITIRNWGRLSVDLDVRLRFDARVEDVFQVRGLLEERLGRQDAPEWEHGVLRFRYHGKDGLLRSLSVFLPDALAPDGTTGAGTSIRLESRAETRLNLRLVVQEAPDEATDRVGPPSHDLVGPRPGSPTRPSDAWPGGIARVNSDSLALNQTLTRSFADLQLLRSSIRDHDFIAAGIPWFATLFGRDSLIASLQLLPYDSRTAAETLRLLATLQGTRVDEWRDEEPGKILHELRVGEMARSGEIPHGRYYGTVDATPLFLIVLAEYSRWTGELSLFVELEDNVRRALEWIDQYGDLDGDGYVEYRSNSEHGLINQGWKDSGDAIVDQRGAIAEPPIVLVEVQAYIYAAKVGIAELYARRGDAGRAEQLRSEAEALRNRFNRDFWLDSLGCYALALEARKQPLRVVSSNAGHALWCGIADTDKARRVAQRLMAPDMYSGWGVRTLSASSPAYTPIGYHLGTVWPHDSALVAAGLKRYGDSAHAGRIFDGLAAAALDFEHHRLPELLTGFSRGRYDAPIRYPVACHPQAWAAGSLPFLLAQLLGLQPEAFEGRLRVVDPWMPGFVDVLELAGVRVGGATVDLRFESNHAADGGAAKVRVLRVEGKLDVRTESPAGAATVTRGV